MSTCCEEPKHSLTGPLRATEARSTVLVSGVRELRRKLGAMSRFRGVGIYVVAIAAIGSGMLQQAVLTGAQGTAEKPAWCSMPRPE